MKAMILAAGKGMRVRPITHVLPKPMIPLVRKPVMEFLVEHLKAHDIKQIMGQHQPPGTGTRSTSVMGIASAFKWPIHSNEI